MSSQRLTDEELADVTARVQGGLCHRCAGTGNERPFLECPACNGSGVFSLSTDTMLSVLFELQERRALDRDIERDILRLADVCLGFYERNGRWPDSTTHDLVHAISKVLRGGR